MRQQPRQTAIQRHLRPHPQPLVHQPGLGPCNQAYHTPWTKPPFNIDAARRKQRPGDIFDPSVRERWGRDAEYQKRWPTLF